MTFTTNCRDVVARRLAAASLRAWGSDDASGWRTYVIVPIQVAADIEETGLRMARKAEESS